MTEQELRDLQERSQLVGDLTNHPGWPLLVDRANLSIFQRQHLLLNGAKDWEQYREEIMWIRGASYVLKIPALVAEELKTELDYQDERAKAEDEDDILVVDDR